ncbi:MAG: 2-oxo acid dehydrogenase subunit E2 [Gammaproteobacteria bacterium]|nr:2-oxo acid dehydrogenase subunit E2 [Gammaproteobacteria bacterium]MDH4256933.1 2-oxo acid dehydrogenase subunit E2 [Gammaproteobacteria bacterium]
MSQYVFKLPDLGEGTVESEIGEWFIKVGDLVSEEDVVATMMTDKAAVELSSPVSGRVVSLAGEPGDMIAVGAPLVVFEAGEGAAESAAAPAATEAPPPAPGTRQEPEAVTATAVPAGDSRKIVTSPAVRRRAREAGIDLAKVPGSGAGGRILRHDFDRYLLKQPPASRPASAPPVSAAPAEVKVIGLRRVIAERMTASKREIPHFAYVEEIDVSEVEALRRHLNERRDAAGRLTLLPFIGLALVRALREYPQCNTTYDKERNVLLRHPSVHLGVATQTPDGLKVPVVRNCDNRGLDELASEIRRVSDAARDNSIRREELGGSTITITSLGKLGGIASTPVINQPEVAIIGINRAVERPVVMNGQVTIRLMMNLSSSFDHRFVDGYDAAAMIQRIKDMLEHPATIFMPD